MTRLSRRGIGLLLILSALGSGCDQEPGWQDWNHYADHFVQDDGRVVDRTFDRKSTSEGQSYALFFTLVANDRERFAKILQWTSTHLADGHLEEKLPAWHWGQQEDGGWGVKDPNSAADGDMWTAYALLEAGRLWQEPAYTELGRRVLANIASREVVDYGEGGKILMPAPAGFTLEDGRLRIDPSYMPPFQLRYFGAVADPAGPWLKVLATYQKLAPQIFAAGVAPDLVILNPKGNVEPDNERADGSYDAIRVYLWAAMSGHDAADQLPLLSGFARLIEASGALPETVETASGRAVGKARAPGGFIAASIPFLDALGQADLAGSLRRQLWFARLKARLRERVNYYDESLTLFAMGYADKHYRIGEDGRVLPAWAEVHSEPAAAAKP